MLLVLAQLSPPASTQDFNASFFAWLFVSILGVVSLLVQLKALKRVPSMDVEFVELKSKLTALNVALDELADRVNETPTHDAELAAINEQLKSGARHMARIDARLEDGDEKLASLREKQAVNATSLEALKTDMHHVKLTVTAVAAKLKVRSE